MSEIGNMETFLRYSVIHLENEIKRKNAAGARLIEAAIAYIATLPFGRLPDEVLQLKEEVKLAKQEFNS